MNRRDMLTSLIGIPIASLSLSGKSKESISADDNLFDADGIGPVELTNLDPNTKGKVVGCYAERRSDSDEPLFIDVNGTVVANLEGYAIIPIETWEKLTGKKFI